LIELEGKTLAETSLEEMEAAWQIIKQKERSSA